MKPAPKILVAISIDTEADHQARGWIKSSQLTFHSVTQGIPKVLSPLFGAYEARPTYLLTTEVMDDAASAAILRAEKDCELGTHLHGDYIEPQKRILEIAGSVSEDFNCYYSAEIEAAKIKNITEQFKNVFGFSPLSYRAGRYAASGRSAKILSDLGYRVDTSVTPGILWTQTAEPNQILDFRAAPLMPYHPSVSDLSQKGDLLLWEIPVTVIPRPWWRNQTARIYQSLRGRDYKTVPLWLRPSSTSEFWLKWIINRVLTDYAQEKTIVFNIMFHSMEIMQGASPYSKTKESTEGVIKRLDFILKIFSDLQAKFVTLAQCVDIISGR